MISIYIDPDLFESIENACYTGFKRNRPMNFYAYVSDSRNIYNSVLFDLIHITNLGEILPVVYSHQLSIDGKGKCELQKVPQEILMTFGEKHCTCFKCELI